MSNTTSPTVTITRLIERVDYNAEPDLRGYYPVIKGEFHEDQKTDQRMGHQTFKDLLITLKRVNKEAKITLRPDITEVEDHTERIVPCQAVQVDYPPIIGIAERRVFCMHLKE